MNLLSFHWQRWARPIILQGKNLELHMHIGMLRKQQVFDWGEGGPKDFLPAYR
jgi:hypothetical protein